MTLHEAKNSTTVNLNKECHTTNAIFQPLSDKICMRKSYCENILATVMLVILLIMPVDATAHPHVFVDVKLRVSVDKDGAFEGVEVQWMYDDFYSLLLLTDMGLDPDGNGSLEDNELLLLDGFDLNWVEGFAGDTIATRNGKPVVLGPPQRNGIKVENGLVISTHFRSSSGMADGIIIKAFDPTFYTAYNLVGSVIVEGPCTAKVQNADLDAAYTMVEELLYAMPASKAEDDFPKVGEAFADTVSLSCVF